MAALAQAKNQSSAMRTLGLLLWVAAVALAGLAASWFDEWQLLHPQAKAAQEQLVRARAAKASGMTESASPPAAVFLGDARQLQTLARQSQATPSEARNYVALLALAKKACEASGLRDCQATRGSVAATPAAASPARPSASASVVVPMPLTEYAIKVIGGIDQSQFMGMFTELDKAGRLYRVSRANIMGRRAEVDLIFWLDEKAELSRTVAGGKP